MRCPTCGREIPEPEPAYRVGDKWYDEFGEEVLNPGENVREKHRRTVGERMQALTPGRHIEVKTKEPRC